MFVQGLNELKLKPKPLIQSRRSKELQSRLLASLFAIVDVLIQEGGQEPDGLPDINVDDNVIVLHRAPLGKLFFTGGTLLVERAHTLLSPGMSAGSSKARRAAFKHKYSATQSGFSFFGGDVAYFLSGAGESGAPEAAPPPSPS
jgi:hypothetical protein